MSNTDTPVTTFANTINPLEMDDENSKPADMSKPLVEFTDSTGVSLNQPAETNQSNVKPGKPNDLSQNQPTDLNYPPELDHLIKKYQRMFSGIRGTCNLYQHQFCVRPDFAPHLCKHYELPGRKKEEGRPVIKDWLKDNTIQPSDSRY